MLEVVPVVLIHDAGEDTSRLAAEAAGVDPCVFESPPGGFEQQPLLRVGGQRLFGRDAEEFGIEILGVGEEAAFVGVAGARVVGVGVIHPTEVPAALGREWDDAVGAPREQVPEPLRR
jgi:hypothetical protein